MLQAAPTKTKGIVSKAWLFRYQIDKRERVMGLGSVRVVSLAEARAKANEARKLLAAGIDPMTRRDAQRMAARAAELQSATFKEVLDQLLDSHGDKWRATHAKQYRNSMERYCKPLMAVAVGDIDTAMVIKILEPEWRRASETLERIRRLFRKLVASDAIADLALLLLTATRSQEARGARWDEFDFASSAWTIPPSRMKRAREHRVPLSREAIKLIERLPRIGEYLFTLNGTVPIASLSLRRALQRHAGEGFSVHGLRSTFRVWGSECTATPRELLEVALAHSVGNAAEQAYARSD